MGNAVGFGSNVAADWVEEKVGDDTGRLQLDSMAAIRVVRIRIILRIITYSVRMLCLCQKGWCAPN